MVDSSHRQSTSLPDSLLSVVTVYLEDDVLCRFTNEESKKLKDKRSRNARRRVVVRIPTRISSSCWNQDEIPFSEWVAYPIQIRTFRSITQRLFHDCRFLFRIVCHVLCSELRSNPFPKETCFDPSPVVLSFCCLTGCVRLVLSALSRTIRCSNPTATVPGHAVMTDSNPPLPDSSILTRWDLYWWPGIQICEVVFLGFLYRYSESLKKRARLFEKNHANTSQMIVCWLSLPSSPQRMHLLALSRATACIKY